MQRVEDSNVPVKKETSPTKKVVSSKNKEASALKKKVEAAAEAAVNLATASDAVPAPVSTAAAKKTVAVKTTAVKAAKPETAPKKAKKTAPVAAASAAAASSASAPKARKSKSKAAVLKSASEEVSNPAAASASTTEDSSKTVATLEASNVRMNYNVDSRGHAYRTFKLISVDDELVTKEHSATQSSRKPIKDYGEGKFRFILCPRNAASKIFTSWSYANKDVDVLTKSHTICIKETTRKSMHRDFFYTVIRESKENTYSVTAADGSKKNICSKFSNKLVAIKKKDVSSTAATSASVDSSKA